MCANGLSYALKSGKKGLMKSKMTSNRKSQLEFKTAIAFWRNSHVHVCNEKKTNR